MVKAFKVLLENNKSGQIETVYMWKGIAGHMYNRNVKDPTLVRGMKDWKARDVAVATDNKVMVRDGDDYFVEYNNVPATQYTQKVTSYGN